MAIESREDLKQYVDLIENRIKNNGVGSIIGVYDEADWDNEDEDKLYSVYLDGNKDFYGLLLIEEVPYDDIGWVCITLQTEIDKLNEKYDKEI